MEATLVESIIRRLDEMDRKLELLLDQQCSDSIPMFPPETVTLKHEIAAVKLAGGDLVSHFKNKAKAQMRARA